MIFSLKSRLQKLQGRIGAALDFIPLIIDGVLCRASKEKWQEPRPMTAKEIQLVKEKDYIPVAIHMRVARVQAQAAPEALAAQAAPTAPVESAQAKHDRIAEEQAAGKPLSFQDSLILRGSHVDPKR